MPKINKRTDSYQPPRSYWKEIERTQLAIHQLDTTENGPPYTRLPRWMEIIGLGRLTSKAETRIAAWQAEDPSTTVVWDGVVIGKEVGPSYLTTVERVCVDPVLTLTAAPDDSQIRTGALETLYDINPLLERLRTWHLHIPDITRIDDLDFESSPPDKKLANAIGRQGLGQETFDYVLDELSRGASGQYTITPPER